MKRILVSLGNDLKQGICGLILGGGDVNPTLYNELLNGSTHIDTNRDTLEW